MRCFMLLTFAFVASLHAQAGFAEGKNSLRLQFAKSSETDLVTVVVGDYQASPESNYIVGATWGRHLSDTLFGLPLEMTANLGLQYLAERGYQEDGVGGTAFIKAHYQWELPFTDKKVRLGLGEGLSYVSRIPMSEKRDFAKKGVESEKLLNYLEWTIDLPLRQFAAVDRMLPASIEELSFGFIVWHRSSIFGLMGNSGGGVNFMGFGFEGRY